MNTKRRITVYGSHYKLANRFCHKELIKIVKMGKRKIDVDNCDVGYVANLPYEIKEPDVNSPDYDSWIYEKCNHYIEVSDFNAFFILKKCENSSVHKEVDIALDGGFSYKSLIILEKEKGGKENSAGSSLIKGSWQDKYYNPPVEYINYDDFDSAWKMILGRFLSLY